jgi:Zn-dependent metalloprotease
MRQDGKSDSPHPITRLTLHGRPRRTDTSTRGAAKLSGSARTALIPTLLASLVFAAAPAPRAHARAKAPARGHAEQAEPRGRVTASFMAASEPANGARQAKQSARPAWVEDALARSLAHLQQQHTAAGKREAAAEFALRRADQDDLGQTHMRLDQMRNGVPVFGGQLVTQLDAEAVLSVTGREFADARGVDTTPTLSPAEAIAAARAAMGTTGVLAREPEAKLVVLPQAIVDGQAGATLCYMVELLVEDGTEATGRHRYFVDAGDGRIVWHYDAMARGTGHSLYSGEVNINTLKQRRSSTFEFRRYLLKDDTRGGMYTVDAMNEDILDIAGDLRVLWSPMTDLDDVWGDGTTNDRQSAAVDAHYGAARSWDYFLNNHDWHGIDNAGLAMGVFVHHNSNHNNAYWNGRAMVFGDGDGVRWGPFVPLDIVGHEYTHAVTGYTADLIYANESGALNESFSDIFGTAIEYDTDSSILGPIFRPDYQHGEDAYTPGTDGDASRDLEDPTKCGQPDHYSKLSRLAPGEDPGQGNDYGWVHTNSGIQNKAFYLLAEGGIHPVSGVQVEGIGLPAAAKVFFRALTLKLFPTATFADARAATVSAAAEIYGLGSQQHVSTERAWDAVGPLRLSNIFYYEQPSLSIVRPSAAVGRIQERFTFSSQFVGYTMLKDYPETFDTWTHVASGAGSIFFYNADNGAGAVGSVAPDGTFTMAGSFPPGSFSRNWTHAVWHDGSLLLYNANSGTAIIGRVSGGFTQYNTYTTFSTGWTDIVDVQGHLLFYNQHTGEAVVGTFDEVFDQGGGPFPFLVRIDYRDVRGHGFAPGWTQIVDTGNGVLFYNGDSGQYVVGDFDAAGNYADRVADRNWMVIGAPPLWEYSRLKTGWTHIVAANYKLLFYDGNTGEAMIGSVLPAARSHELREEPLRVEASGLEGIGHWTHVVETPEVRPSAP